jgi:hypothetical protein
MSAGAMILGLHGRTLTFSGSPIYDSMTIGVETIVVDKEQLSIAASCRCTAYCLTPASE